MRAEARFPAEDDDGVECLLVADDGARIESAGLGRFLAQEISA